MRRSPAFMLVGALIACSVLVALSGALFAVSRVRSAEVRAQSFRTRALHGAIFACRLIKRGLELDRNGYDSELEEWAKPRAFPLEGLGSVSVSIRDEDRFLPINSLLLPDGVTLRAEMAGVLRRALERVGLREELTPRLLDFLDADDRPRLGGEESDLSGYRPVNRPLLDVRELLLARFLEREHVLGTSGRPGLADLFTPFSSGRVNLNTAPKEVLTLLDEEVDERAADALIEQRGKKPLSGIPDLRAVPGWPAGSVPRLMNLVGFTSLFYRAKIAVEGEEGRATFEAVFRKGPQGVDLIFWREE